MKNKKEKFLDSLADGVIELILTGIVFAIGFLMLCGISKVFSINMTEDFDFIVLIGIIAIAVIALIISLIAMLFKRKNK